MGTVKIKMNTWDRRGNRETKFKRNVAPREAFIEFCDKTKKVTVKNGETKWKRSRNERISCSKSII